MQVRKSNNWIKDNWMLLLILVFFLFMGKGLKSLFDFISTLLGGDSKAEAATEEKLEEEFNAVDSEIKLSNLRFPSSFYSSRANAIYQLLAPTNWIYSEDEDLQRIKQLLTHGPGLENYSMSQVIANPGSFYTELSQLGVVVGQSGTYTKAYLNADEIRSIYKAFGQRPYGHGVSDGGEPNMLDNAGDYIADNVKENATLWYWLRAEVPSYTQIESALSARGVNM